MIFGFLKLQRNHLKHPQKHNFLQFCMNLLCLQHLMTLSFLIYFLLNFKFLFLLKPQILVRQLEYQCYQFQQKPKQKHLFQPNYQILVFQSPFFQFECHQYFQFKQYKYFQIYRYFLAHNHKQHLKYDCNFKNQNFPDLSIKNEVN